MKIIIDDGRASEVFYNGQYYKTKVELDVSFADALRINKIFNATILGKAEPYNPFYFAEGKELAMWADIDTISGWGNVGLNLIKSSFKFFKTALIGRVTDVRDPVILGAQRKDAEAGMGVILHEQPRHQWLDLPFEKKIAVVPWETTKCPASWIPRINSCTALIVPCVQNKQAFIDSGVTIPIELMHWGVDTEAFYEIERPERPIFTFGTLGNLSRRKGTDMLVKAFLKAFPTEQDVRIIFKTSANHFFWAVRDKRVIIDQMPVPHDELMKNFFGEIDCFVMPTRGEGCGMPIMEAMSTGVPAIVTNWSGPVDFVTDETGYLLDYKLEPAKDFSEITYKEDCGEWALPSEEHLIKLMRHAYENRDEVKQKGKKAAKEMRDNWTWEKQILGYVEAVKKHF